MPVARFRSSVWRTGWRPSIVTIASPVSRPACSAGVAGRTAVTSRTGPTTATAVTHAPAAVSLSVSARELAATELAVPNKPPPKRVPPHPLSERLLAHLGRREQECARLGIGALGREHQAAGAAPRDHRTADREPERGHEERHEHAREETAHVRLGAPVNLRPGVARPLHAASTPRGCLSCKWHGA